MRGREKYHHARIPPSTHAHPPSHIHTLQACNAIGLLVIYVGFTGHTWAELAPTYLTEAFDRNAERVIKKYPELDTTEPNPKSAHPLALQAPPTCPTHAFSFLPFLTILSLLHTHT